MLACVGIALFLGFCALGTWQVYRLQWKLDLIDRVERRVHSAPQPPPAPSTWPQLDAKAHEYQPTALQGQWLLGGLDAHPAAACAKRQLARTAGQTQQCGPKARVGRQRWLELGENRCWHRIGEHRRIKFDSIHSSNTVVSKSRNNLCCSAKTGLQFGIEFERYRSCKNVHCCNRFWPWHWPLVFLALQSRRIRKSR